MRLSLNMDSILKDLVGKGGLNKRYKIITSSYNFEAKSILDYGCGLCNFYKYLIRKK